MAIWHRKKNKKGKEKSKGVQLLWNLGRFKNDRLKLDFKP